MVGRIRDKDRKIVPSTGRKRSEEEIKDSRKEGADFIRERETLLKQGVEKTEAAKQAAGVLSQGPTAAQQIAALQAQAPPPVAPEAIPAEAPEAEGASGGPPQATPSLAGIFTGSNFQERAAEAGGQGIASPVPLGGIALAGGAGAVAGFKAIAGASPQVQTALAGKAITKVQTASVAAKSASTIDKIKGFAGWTAILGFGGGPILNLARDVTGFKFLKKDAPKVREAINTFGQQSSGIATDTALTPDAKMFQLTQNENTVSRMEERLKGNSIQNRILRNNGEMLDIQTDVFEAKSDIITAKGAVRIQQLQREQPTFDEQIIADWVSQATETELAKARAEYDKQKAKMGF